MNVPLGRIPVILIYEVVCNHIEKLKPFIFPQMWSSVMRKLIHKCYDHHGAGFLLEFSRKLMIATQDSNKIKVIDNGDGTRSMRSAVSDKLLVTFRSENQDYDKKQRQQNNSFSTQSPLKKRCSLSLGINASDPRLPRCEDIFLCDNCGSSFKSLPEVLVRISLDL